jgi:flagellar hook-associated protein 1 FlgK
VDSYDIGISGLFASQKAFEVIGNNIANAATEGFHRQRLNLSPGYSSQVGSVIIGGGVDVAQITRLIDNILENEICRQKSSLGQVYQESTTLSTIEIAFGELTANGGLNAAMDDFFNALHDLSAHPSDITWQSQAVSAAETMANQFRTLEDFLTELDTQIVYEAETVIEEVNALVETIAGLNEKIERLEIGGAQANNIRDQRDQCISELSELVSVESQSGEHGVVNISVAGIPVLTGTSAIELNVGLDSNLGLGISVAGDLNYYVDIEGGRLGGLLSLKNNIVSGIYSDLNDLASAIIKQVNQYHVQGVGSAGSFTNLIGWSMGSEALADVEPPVYDGNIYIRVTNKNTGEVTRTAIAINAATDTLSSIATDITAITGLSASVSDSKLHIQADTGYEFDFLPCVLSSPTDSDYTGATSPPTVSVSGIYTGTDNQTYTCTVSGTGSVGNGTLQITVADGFGNIINTINIGSGYAAGDILDVGDGIKIALGVGDLVDGNTFEIDVFAQTDTSGVLAAVGINTFFSGGDASDISVSSDISSSPMRIATSLGSDMTDNVNILRLAELHEQTVTELDSMTPGEFYRKLVTDIGRELSAKVIRQENIESTVQSLENQQSEISGVNINDEAAQMLVFEQMFQAMAKYMSTIQESLATIIELI